MSVPHCPPFWTEGSIKSRRGVPYLYQAVPVFFVLLCYTTQTKSASKSQSTAERSQGGNSRQEPEGGTACNLMQHYLQPGNSLTAKEGQQEPWAVLPGALTFFFSYISPGPHCLDWCHPHWNFLYQSITKIISHSYAHRQPEEGNSSVEASLRRL